MEFRLAKLSDFNLYNITKNIEVSIKYAQIFKKQIDIFSN